MSAAPASDTTPPEIARTRAGVTPFLAIQPARWRTARTHADLNRAEAGVISDQRRRARADDGLAVGVAHGARRPRRRPGDPRTMDGAAHLGPIRGSILEAH